MKKYRNITIGGIENKVFNLVLVTILLIMAVLTVATILQSNQLTAQVEETSEKQRAAVTTEVNSVMDAVIRQTMDQLMVKEAETTDALFDGVRKQVTILGMYAQTVLSSPENFPAHPWSLPDPANDGRSSAMVICAGDVSLEDEKVRSRLDLAANLSDMMIDLRDTFGIDSIYIGFPERTFLSVSDSPSSWYADGKLKDYDPTVRPWYRRAVEAGELIFTDLGDNYNIDNETIECAMPVYSPEGELLAVVGADLFLTSMQETVRESDKDGGFLAVVNQDGHVICSPRTEGLLKARGRDDDGLIDLRQTENGALSALAAEALHQKTDVRLVDLEDGTWYMVGVPLKTVGWTMIAAYSRDRVLEPAAQLTARYEAIREEGVETYRGRIRSAQRITLGVLLVLAALLIVNAIVIGKRIVKPLNTMTRRIASLSEESPEFRMEDAFRTGDEVESLAESFATLSHRTVQYVEQVRKVTAEKERINSELTMAKEIQGSQLPRIFPPYPNNPHFDLYASMIPAREVGGDFYDFFLVDDDHLAMVMADVSGKGVPAALFMMIAKTLIKNRLQSGEDLEAVLANVNNQLMEGNAAGMFVTAWVGVLTISTGEGVAVNAGHEHPILRRAGGRFELIRYRHSLSMAVLEDARFHAHSFELHPGDTLFVYTDGVMEATNRADELMGEQRMLDALNRNPDADPKTMLNHMKQAIDTFVDGAEQFDDITMMCLKYNG